MFSGGNLILAVGNLDIATRFYTEQLGLRLTHRFGNRWVMVDAGPSYWGATDDSGAGLALGLQPHTPDYPAPGTRGSVGFGLETYDVLESLMSQLSARGVRFTSEVIAFEAGKCIALDDVDGNETYLWEMTGDMLPEEDRQTKAAGDAGPPSVTGGHAIVYVSDMDRAVHYYSEVLGLPLTYRYEDKVAFVEAGRKLVIALHPTSSRYPAPGTRGAVRIALHVDEPIDRVLSRLAARGVRLANDKGGAREQGSTLIEDLDGNPIELIEEGALSRTAAEEVATTRS